MLTLQILALLISLGAILGYVYCKIRRLPNSEPLLPSLDSRDKWWIRSLTLVYFLISLYNFANTQKYDQAWHGVNLGDKLVLTLAQPTKVSEFFYATGYIKGKYTISALDSAGNSLALIDKSSSLGYSPFFRWNKIDFNPQVAITSISVQIDSGPVDLTQFAMLDSNGKLFSNYSIQANQQQNLLLSSLVSHTLPSAIDDNWRSSTVFDEIYYATSAYQYLHGISPDAWVHPQLGIYLIILGIVLFGMSPLGWRIMPDILSTLMIPLIYLFARRIFSDRRSAIAASLLLMCEFMHFTMGRTASIDPTATFFLLLEYYFIYSYAAARLRGVDFVRTLKLLLLAGISFALALSSKWSGLYSATALVGVFVYCELIYQRPSFSQFMKVALNLALLFILLPAIIYLIVYIPYVMVNHNDNLWDLVVLIQKGILDFNLHGLANATHPYASNWWSWPLDRMPLSVYYWQDPRGYLSTSMVLMGNPAIYWTTWVVILLLAQKFYYEHTNFKVLFVLLAIIAQYFPYILVARISFIYYFYSVSPFLILGISYWLNTLWESKNNWLAIISYAYLLINLLLFILFFSALAGLEVPRSYTATWLLWMKSWNF